MAQMPSQPVCDFYDFLQHPGKFLRSCQGCGGNGAAGNFTSFLECRGAGAGNILCCGCARTRGSSEGWVSWEDPVWIHPNPFIPHVGTRAPGWAWLGFGPVLGWNSYGKAGHHPSPPHRIKHILIHFSSMPRINGCQRVGHTNTDTPGLIQLHAQPKPGIPGRAELRGRPGAAENAGALHVCCFHVRWFPRKPLALHVCRLTPYLLSFG